MTSEQIKTNKIVLNGYIASSLPRAALLECINAHKGIASSLYWYRNDKRALVNFVKSKVDQTIQDGNGPIMALLLYSITVYKFCVYENDAVTLSEGEPFSDLLDRVR